MLIDEFDIFDNDCEVDEYPVTEYPNIENEDCAEFQAQVNIYNIGGNYYQHIQSVASTIWTANHNLNKLISSAHIEDSGGNMWQTIEIDNIDLNNVAVKVGNAPFGGIMIIT